MALAFKRCLAGFVPRLFPNNGSGAVAFLLAAVRPRSIRRKIAVRRVSCSCKRPLTAVASVIARIQENRASISGDVGGTAPDNELVMLVRCAELVRRGLGRADIRAGEQMDQLLPARQAALQCFDLVVVVAQLPRLFHQWGAVLPVRAVAIKDDQTIRGQSATCRLSLLGIYGRVVSDIDKPFDVHRLVRDGVIVSTMTMVEPDFSGCCTSSAVIREGSAKGFGYFSLDDWLCAFFSGAGSTMISP